MQILFQAGSSFNISQNLMHDGIKEIFVCLTLKFLIWFIPGKAYKFYNSWISSHLEKYFWDMSYFDTGSLDPNLLLFWAMTYLSFWLFQLHFKFKEYISTDFKIPHLSHVVNCPFKQQGKDQHMEHGFSFRSEQEEWFIEYTTGRNREGNKFPESTLWRKLLIFKRKVNRVFVGTCPSVSFSFQLRHYNWWKKPRHKEINPLTCLSMSLLFSLS